MKFEFVNLCVCEMCKRKLRSTWSYGCVRKDVRYEQKNSALHGREEDAYRLSLKG